MQNKAGFKYRSPTRSAKNIIMSSASKDKKSASKEKKPGNNENLPRTVVAGTFDWLAAQKKPTSKNFFGLTKRFKGAPKSDKKPGPNTYKLNSRWNDEKNVLNKTGSSTNFKSVYYH